MRTVPSEPWPNPFVYIVLSTAVRNHYIVLSTAVRNHVSNLMELFCGELAQRRSTFVGLFVCMFMSMLSCVSSHVQSLWQQLHLAGCAKLTTNSGFRENETKFLALFPNVIGIFRCLIAILSNLRPMYVIRSTVVLGFLLFVDSVLGVLGQIHPLSFLTPKIPKHYFKREVVQFRRQKTLQD